VALTYLQQLLVALVAMIELLHFLLGDHHVVGTADEHHRQGRRHTLEEGEVVHGEEGELEPLLDFFAEEVGEHAGDHLGHSCFLGDHPLDH
jgi:hypothetical protein